ncbi:hypothetical protein [Lysobacter gummosus]|uniref:hypothetical protein n=1 Tax=Lysobacter gummosus TaxID=262324 RepID=UPI0036262AE2
MLDELKTGRAAAGQRRRDGGGMRPEYKARPDAAMYKCHNRGRGRCREVIHAPGGDSHRQAACKRSRR